MDYLAVVGRQPEISFAELTALFPNARFISHQLAGFQSDNLCDIHRLGGSLKIALKLQQKPLDFLLQLPPGKLTFGISDYSPNASAKSINKLAAKFKHTLKQQGRNARIIQNQTTTIPVATALYNHLDGQNAKKVEFIKVGSVWYRVVGVQDINAYAKRDQARPARDARVGMLPPKLAQILINLCGSLKPSARILDPFCGTGVVLQEALLMGYQAYGTDINERMIEYSRKNLEWLKKAEMVRPEGIRRLASRGRAPAARGDGPAGRGPRADRFQLSVADATSFQWTQPIDAVACEAYLGKPFSKIPSEIELKVQQQECSSIILGFLKNLASQIKKDTPIVIAIPAWLRPNEKYKRLDILDEIEKLGYNVNNKSRRGLLYRREGQIVARDIIILRKK